MDTIERSGDNENAPVIIKPEGRCRCWSGKSVMTMTKFDLEDLYQFCMDGALELGIESVVAGEPEVANPFHPNFLLGMPFRTFNTFYQRGRLEATGSWLEARGIGLFAENSYDRTAVPV
jgi:hypothetical protein